MLMLLEEGFNHSEVTDSNDREAVNGSKEEDGLFA